METHKFDTNVVISLTEKLITITSDENKMSIDNINIDTFSYKEHTENRISPSTVQFRFIGISVALVILSELVFGGWSASSWIFAIIIGVINIIVFFVFMLDSFLDLKILSSITNKYFSNYGYIVTIGNNSGNNIVFLANLDELGKIKSLEKEINDVKVKISNNTNSTNNLDELKKLGELKQMGVITEEEFNIKKSKLL